MESTVTLKILNSAVRYAMDLLDSDKRLTYKYGA